MSLEAEREEDTGTSVLGRVEEWYHVPVLLTVLVAMFAIRMQSYSNFVRSGQVFYSGNDAWYHLRAVQYTVRHWPFTIPFDPWTNYPVGTSVGQFGTLYDQIVATVALILGLGSPSEQLVAKTLLVAPAVFGALTAIPVYFLGKRLAGRLPGLFGAVVLLLLPGTFLRRTLVGVSDHNGVEPFFQALAVLGLVVAFGVAEREKPVWELVAARDADALKRPLTWAAVGGVATALYMWVWPPGVLLVGIVGVFVVLKASSDVVNGDSPEPVAFAGAVASAVTGLLMLVQVDAFVFSPTRFSLLQPALAFGVAAGCVVLAALARWVESADAPPATYPAVVFGLIGVTAAATAVLAPGVFGTLSNNLLRIVGFSANAATRTIGEAQPFLDADTLRQYGVNAAGRIVIEYGFTLFTAIAAAAWMLTKPLAAIGDARRYGYAVGGFAVVSLLFLAPSVLDAFADALGMDPQILGLLIVTAVVTGAALLAEQRAETLFLVVWAAFITAAAFTQVRFNYYLAVVVAVFNAYLVGELLKLIGVRASAAGTALRNVERYQVFAVAAAAMLIVAPALVVPVGIGQGQGGATATAWQVGGGAGPGSITKWDGSLAWLQNNTPEEGAFGGAENAASFDYYDSFQPPADGDFDYPDGTYGVLSWWDYGHWITTQSHRIPNANPFQEGATAAANFLLAPSEQRAMEVLDRRAEANETTRYVMVDWKMAAPTQKYGAPIVFYDDSGVTRSEFYSYLYSAETGEFQTVVKHDRYYQSMMTRLYEYHGSAMSPQPFVVDWETRVTQGGLAFDVLPRGNESAIKTFENVSAAREYARQDGSAQVGGIGPYPTEEVKALQHYRLVKMSDSSATASGGYLRSQFSTARAVGFPQQYLQRTNPAWVKTFEKVPGATVQGSGAPANVTVTASVEMRSPTANSTFTYVQRAQTNAQGEFTMTLPYSTTGYGAFGPEKNGRTDVNVRATGPYTFTTNSLVADNGSQVVYNATHAVAEEKVTGVSDAPVRVELTQRPAPENATATEGATGQTPAIGGNESDGSDQNATATAIASDGGGDGDGSDADANGSNASALTATAAEATVA